MRTAKTRLARGVGLSLVCLAASAIARADSSGQWKSGQEAYDKVCGYCHEKGVGPVIKGRGAPPEYRAIVRQGRRAMPQFRKTEIDDETLSKLIEYVR